jgi:hypothetical protein
MHSDRLFLINKEGAIALYLGMGNGYYLLPITYYPKRHAFSASLS